MPDDPGWCDRLGPRFHAAVRAAERRGRMTYAELDAVLPREDCSSRQVEIVLDHLGRKGVDLIEDDGE